METIRTVEDIKQGIKALQRVEPRFADFVQISGIPPLRRSEAGFAGLVRIIVGQQVSKASAAAIWRRVQQELQPLTPQHVRTIELETMQQAGLSRPKINALWALAEAVCGRACDLDALTHLDDDMVRAQLTDIKGIGPWSAEIYLLSCLGRPDAWPTSDLALQIAAQHGFELPHRPGHGEMRALGDPWRPWRAIAARVLWAYYAAIKGRDATSETETMP